MNEDTPEIAVIFLNAVIQRPNMRLIEKPQDMLLELTAAFARNNLHQGDAFRNCLLHHPVQLFFDLAAVIVDIIRSYAVGLFSVDLDTLPRIMTSQFWRLSGIVAQM